MESHPPSSAPALDPAQESALAALRRGTAFLLVGHERPDGDCIGSQAALARALQVLGKQVHVVNPDAAPANMEPVCADGPFSVFEGTLPEHDVCVLLDFNVLSRTGPMAEALGASRALKMVVDHHPPGDEGAWWDEAFVDVSASATGLLVHRIVGALGVELDPTIARGVFTAMVTDTGWFRYSNTDAETLAAAASLVATGVAPADVYRSIYQRTGPQEPLAIGQLLGRTRYHAGGRLAVVDLPLPVAGQPALEDGDTVLDILRAVESVEVVLFVRERAPGICKLSARSKTSYDVNALARGFGGGGHAKAAGATIEGRLDEVRDRLVEAAVAAFAS